MIKEIFLYLFAFLLIVGSILFLLLKTNELLNIFIAYITSSIVLLATFKNYKDIVLQKVSLIDKNNIQDRDIIDKIDDPFRLYEKEIANNNSLANIIKEEKKIFKKNKRDLKEIFFSSITAFKPIKVFSYALFVIGFLYLVKNRSLNLLYYLPTLIIPNIIAIIYLLYKRGYKIEKD